MITARLLFYNNRTGNYQPVIPVQEFGMEIKEIRRLRLRQLIDEKFNGKATRLAEALDMKPPQIHRWLNGGQGMVEESAKKICDKLSLPPGYLDREGDAPGLPAEVSGLFDTVKSLTESGRMSLEEVRRLTDLLKTRD